MSPLSPPPITQIGKLAEMRPTVVKSRKVDVRKKIIVGRVRKCCSGVQRVDLKGNECLLNYFSLESESNWVNLGTRREFPDFV